MISAVKRFCNTFLFFLLIFATSATGVSACSSIIVGREASANGYVMLGHTEDIGPLPVINQHKIRRQQHQPGDKVILPQGGTLDEVVETWEYIWSEVPGEEFCDGFINEWGVTIASDQCPSRVQEADLTDGGIGLMLRRLVAQRAKSARDGCRLAGDLVEKFGYHSSGRSYAICDPLEGWVFCVMNGRHWLAARVPDDHVAVIANSYTVREVDLTDTVNYMASDGLIAYARQQGWYYTNEDGLFDFAKTFADTVVAAGSYNVCRQWTGLRYVTDDTVRADWGNLPFSLKADRKFTVSDVMQILRGHYENTLLYKLPSDSSSPHENQFMTTCSQLSQMTFVAELRANLPKEIGLVYWLSLGKPCYSYLVPFYFGMERFPDAYYTQSEPPTDALRDSMLAGPDPDSLEAAFWKFTSFSSKVDSNYVSLGEIAAREQADYDQALMVARESQEAFALKTFEMNRVSAIQALASFSLRQYQMAQKAVEKVLSAK